MLLPSRRSDEFYYLLFLNYHLASKLDPGSTKPILYKIEDLHRQDPEKWRERDSFIHLYDDCCPDVAVTNDIIKGDNDVRQKLYNRNRCTGVVVCYQCIGVRVLP